MGEHKRKSPVTRDARRAFAVACDGMAAEGERIPWDINALMAKYPGTAIEDVIVCVDEPGSLNHQTAERVKLAAPGVPFVHVRLRANSGFHEVKTTAPPAGRMWFQVGLTCTEITCANGMDYEAAPVAPIMVDGLAHGICVTDEHFDRGAELLAAAGKAAP